MQTSLLNNRSILWTKQLTKIIGAAIFLAIAAQISIPLTPIPLTLQTISVLFVGAMFGWRVGLTAVLTYLLAGAVGFPVFANFSFGFGFSSGYLIGFVPAVLLSGLLFNSRQNWLNNFAIFLVSDAVIFLFGIAWLAAFVGWHNACVFGLAPFVFTEMAKLLFLTLVTTKRQ
jgi:biotin transport system substrate-specific component